MIACLLGAPAPLAARDDGAGSDGPSTVAVPPPAPAPSPADQPIDRPALSKCQADAAAAGAPVPSAAALAAAKRAERHLVPFAASPFPYDGTIPGRSVPFMERDADGAYHDSPRGGRLREDVYADRRSIVFAPPRFDPRREDARLILYFHGNCARLARDVAVRQKVLQQLLASRLNAALVAPQMASDALDSSAGHFWNAGFLDRYLDEAAEHLATRSRRRFTAAEIAHLPVVIVAYSGGYLPTAFSLLHAGKSKHRIEGVILLDALFGDDEKFARFIESPTASPFFVSLYSRSSSDNNAAMAAGLKAHGLAVEDSLPDHIGPGTIAIIAKLDASHDEFVTDDGAANPLADVLRRLEDRKVEEAPTAVRAEAPRRKMVVRRRARPPTEAPPQTAAAPADDAIDR